MKQLITAASIIALALDLTLTTRAQVYQFTQIDPLYSAAVSQNGKGVGELYMPNCAVANSITINQGAGTVQDSGTIDIPAATATFNFQQTQSLAAVFPNPPQNVTGDISVTLSYAGGFIPFNTGIQSLAFQGGTIWGFNGSADLSVPLTLSYSLMTGGQTYTGSINTTLGATIDCGSTINIANYPSSIQLIPDKSPLVSNGSDFLTINVTATDGFQFNGLTVSPEPSTFALLGIGGLGLLMVLRRKGRIAKHKSATI
jgi:PEP-CTERM motif